MIESQAERVLFGLLVEDEHAPFGIMTTLPATVRFIISVSILVEDDLFSVIESFGCKKAKELRFWKAE